MLSKEENKNQNAVNKKWQNKARRKIINGIHCWLKYKQNKTQMFDGECVNMSVLFGILWMDRFVLNEKLYHGKKGIKTKSKFIHRNKIVKTKKRQTVECATQTLCADLKCNLYE